MRGTPGQENFRNRRGDYLPLDLEAHWSYLRANLDHPAHGIGNRLGSGLVAWLSRKLHASAASAPQLSILARIALGPRQSLALVEAEGMHVLVGTSADGPPTFFSLEHDSGRKAAHPMEREVSLLSGVFADGRQAGRRNSGAFAASGSHAGLSSGSRTSGRPRLTGRVSWV